MMKRSDVSKALAVTCEFYGRTLSEAAADMMMDDLSDYEPAALIQAIKDCRRELKFFPTVADIIQRVEDRDGRPGAEEAWSLIPKDEYNSCVWTVEMATAYGAAHPHLKNGDHVAARMAFKEVYERETKAARSSRMPATWSASLGNDSSTHAGALLEAVRKNQLTLDHVQKIALIDEPNSIHPTVAGLLGNVIKEAP